MAQRKTLTEQQVSLLRWIAAGCPYGVMDGVHHRISVAALRNRVLVTISGRGSTWAAKITDAGQDYLAQLDGPNPPVPRQANVSVTQQLVDDVIAGGGVLRVPRRGWPSWKMPDYRHRALLAMRHGKVPDGKRLTVTVVDRELEIQLVDAPGYSGGRAELTPVTVPERVGRYHASGPAVSGAFGASRGFAGAAAAGREDHPCDRRRG
jgi:hypothetical protein